MDEPYVQKYTFTIGIMRPSHIQGKLFQTSGVPHVKACTVVSTFLVYIYIPQEAIKYHNELYALIGG